MRHTRLLRPARGRGRASSRPGRSTRAAAPRDSLPYASRGTLLSPGEAAFFQALASAVGKQWLVMTKVRLADIVTCSDTQWGRGFGAAISQKHIDFVLCDHNHATIVLAIELDDRSHNRAERRERDRFVDRVLAAARVRLLRIRARSTYDTPLIRRLIEVALRTDPAALSLWNQTRLRRLALACAAGRARGSAVRDPLSIDASRRGAR